MTHDTVPPASYGQSATGRGRHRFTAWKALLWGIALALAVVVGVAVLLAWRIHECEADHRVNLVSPPGAASVAFVAGEIVLLTLVVPSLVLRPGVFRGRDVAPLLRGAVLVLGLMLIGLPLSALGFPGNLLLIHLGGPATAILTASVVVFTWTMRRDTDMVPPATWADVAVGARTVRRASLKVTAVAWACVGVLIGAPVLLMTMSLSGSISDRAPWCGPWYPLATGFFFGTASAEFLLPFVAIPASILLLLGAHGRVSGFSRPIKVGLLLVALSVAAAVCFVAR